jgi:hypothetical protein
LLRSGLTALSEGLRQAEENSDEIGRYRPAVHFAGVLLAVACAKSRRLVPEIELGKNAREMEEARAIEHLKRAVHLWRMEFSPGDVIMRLTDNPIMEEWGSTLPNLKAQYDKITEDLRKEASS